MRQALERRDGWMEVPHYFSNFNFKWEPCSSATQLNRLGTLSSCVQLYNHFEFHRELTNKSALFRNLKAYCEVNRAPRTFLIVSFAVAPRERVPEHPTDIPDLA